MSDRDWRDTSWLSLAPPMPPVIADNGNADFIGFVDRNKRAVKALDDGCPREWFKWDRSPESLQHNPTALDRWDAEKARVAKLAIKAAKTPVGTSKAYLLAALRGEARNIIDKGRHNNDINKSTYKLRKKYVDTGKLTNAEVAQAIYDAAYELGYVSQIIGTIASGLGIGTDEVRRLVNL